MTVLNIQRDTRAVDGEFTLVDEITVPIGRDIQIRIPAGTTTDFASIPPAVRFLVNRNGTDVAGLVHDYCYRTGAVRRQVADAVLYALCREAGVSSFRASVIYASVALFGAKHFNKSHR